MLRFNTFRSKRYLRSKFVEGRFLLASEASDIELELIDLLRTTIKSSIGDVAIADAWKVTKLSDTQLLVQTGEAWFKGLPFTMCSGKDALVTGASLTAGILPLGVSITDEPTGLGKLITFNDGSTTPTSDYRIVISAREELVNYTDDQFLQNANLTEDTAQKVRIILKIDIVPEASQTTTPIPYTNDSTDQNLVNEIVVTPTAAGNGELISSSTIPGSEQIDGRDLEIILRNNPALGGGNPIPNGNTDQQAFGQGKLIDSKGEAYHVTAVFNDVVSTQVVLRIDKAFGQQDPEIINGSPIILRKRDVYVSDDINGNPLGKLFWPIATLDWNQIDGFTHESKIVDLRTIKTRADELEDKTNKKFNLKLTDGGSISFKDTTLAPATGTITVIDNNFSAGDGVTVDGTTFVNGVDFTVGIDTDATASNLATAIVALPNVSAIAVGSVITITASTSGSAGNSIILARTDSNTINFELSGNTLSGGEEDIPGELSWSSPFTLLNPHGNSMSVAGASTPILDEGSLTYALDLKTGGAIEKGTITVNVTGAGATVTLDPIVLSTTKLGNILKVGTEVVEITAIDDVNNTLDVSPSLVGTGSGDIFLDSFSSGTAPSGVDYYTLAVRKGLKAYVDGQLELENKEISELGDGFSEQLMDYIGAPDESTAKPSYSSSKVLTQGVDLTTAIGELDEAINPLLAPTYTSNIRGDETDSLAERVSILTDAVGDSQEDRSAYLRSEEDISWTGSQVEFTTDIILDIINTKDGTTTTHTILLAGSPIVLAAGESAYITIDRTTSENVTVVLSGTTPIPAQTQADKDIFVLFKRISNTTSSTEELYIPLTNQVFFEGQSTRIGSGGSGAGIVKADFHDPISTTLPTGTSVTLDNVTGVDGDLVLFSNLTVGSNKIYELSGVGVSLVWTAQKLFDGQETPTDGDLIAIKKGDGFADSVGIFDSVDWKFNDTVRYFSGADYWEQSSLKTAAISATTTDDIFTIDLVGSENMVIDYSLFVGIDKEVGQIILSSDGTLVNTSRNSAANSVFDVELFADIVTTTLRFRYTNNGGSSGNIKYSVKRWSNAPGGPSGVPSYSVPPSSTLAAGNIQEIQFHGSGGVLDADSQLKWNSSDKVLDLNGLELKTLSGGIVLNDAQVAPLTIISYDKTLYKFAVLEYSIERNNIMRVGRLLIANDGVIVEDSDDFIETNLTGILFSTTINVSNVEVLYTSTATGSTGTFKYSIRRWA